MIAQFVFEKGVAGQHDRDAVTLMVTGRLDHVLSWPQYNLLRRIFNNLTTLGRMDYNLYGYAFRMDDDAAQSCLSAALETITEVQND